MTITLPAMKYDMTFNGLETVLPLALQQPFKSIMLGGRIIATAGIEPAISLYPMEIWELIIFELQRLPSINPQVRQLQRLLVGHALEIRPTKFSSITLPASLKHYAGIRKKACALLFPNKIEIWNPHTLSSHLDPPKFMTRAGVAGILRGGDDETDEELLNHLCPTAVVVSPEIDPPA